MTMLKKNVSTLLLILSSVLFITSSCDPSAKYEKEEQAEIDTYLSENSNLNFDLKSSGLYYLEVVAGTGRKIETGDTAYMKYTGKFLNGTIFDSNAGTTDSLVMAVNKGYLIQGFDEGLTYMNEGGKSILLIPSKLGYGVSGFYSIPGYAPLLFDVEILKVVPGAGK